MRVAEPPAEGNEGYDAELSEMYELKSGDGTDLKQQVADILGADAAPGTYVTAGRMILDKYDEIAAQFKDTDPEISDKFKLKQRDRDLLGSTAGIDNPLKYAEKLLATRERLYELAVNVKNIEKDKVEDKAGVVSDMRNNLDDFFTEGFNVDTKLEDLRKSRSDIGDTYDRKLIAMED